MIQLGRAAASMQRHVVAPYALRLRRSAAPLMADIASQGKLAVVTDACPLETPAAQAPKVSAIRSRQNAAVEVAWALLRTVALMATTVLHH